MKNRVLFLDTLSDADGKFYREQWNKVPGLDSFPLYNRSGIVRKILLAVGFYIFPPILYLLYNDWKHHLNRYDTVIMSSRRPNKYAVKMFSRQKNMRVIVWYWNIVSNEELSPDYCRKYGCETWSFDKADCRKYDMKFGDTFYFDISEYASDEVLSDLFYVGQDKTGRSELLTKIDEYCKSKNIRTDINLVKDKNSTNEAYRYSERLSYEQVLRRIAKTRAILDLTQPNQTGLTLRPLEALMLGKKLITNNPYVLQSQYLTRGNILYFDEDLSAISDFLEQPMVLNEKGRNHYLFHSWLERILQGREAE